MRWRDGLGFGLRVTVGVLFAQSLIFVINPPEDWFGYLLFALFITAAVFLVSVAVGASSKDRARRGER